MAEKKSRTPPDPGVPPILAGNTHRFTLALRQQKKKSKPRALVK